MKTCINNSIQIYLEQLLKQFDKSEPKYRDRLYDWYKNIRVEIASKGFLYYKDGGREMFLSNPKVLAGGLFYIHSITTGQDVTQRMITGVLGINISSIKDSYRAVKTFLDL